LAALGRRLPGMQNDGAVITATGRYRLDELPVPLLLICARDDLLADCNEAERIVRSGERADFAVFENGGHLLLGRWDEARVAMDRFLMRTANRARGN
jgi:pimeloyl-ACP methyl ester carboxylesterase